MIKQKIAVFDFDKTITIKDSFQDMIFRKIGIKSIPVLIMVFPFIILFLIGIIRRHTVKEKVFSMLFKGMREEKFIEFCQDYSENYIPQILRKEALEKIKWHREKGHKLVIISASVDEWIKPWALKNGFENVVSTKYEISNGVLTGKFSTKNCYGKEKLTRFVNEYGNTDKYYIYMYGDSNGDKEMLKIAQEKFYRKF